jgi:hypothetical protein
VTYQPGTRPEYVAAAGFDLITETGHVGVETREVDGWVYAEWPLGGEHGVPGENVRPHIEDQFRGACRSFLHLTVEMQACPHVVQRER